MSEETYPAWSEILEKFKSGSITEEEYKNMIREKIKREIEEEKQ